MPLKYRLESLLFVSARALSLRQLSELVTVSIEEIEAALLELATEYETSGRGLRLSCVAEKWQMVTAPENAVDIQMLAGQETGGELSRPSLEALTVIAYRGPIAKTHLDAIRGVNCALILRNLSVRGLVESQQGADGDIYYNVSLDFLRHLGVSEVSQLPDYDRLSLLSEQNEQVESSPEPH